jgi:glycosyltransferase involved in cell wall biosynthesis
MNVCMVSYSFYESDNRVRRYAETLARRGDRVEVMALRRPGQAAHEVIRRVHVSRIQQRVVDEDGPFSYLVKLLLFFFRSGVLLTVRHLIRPYQLIHVHSIPDFQVFAALIPRLTGAKIILDIHDIVPELYASKFKIAEDSLIFKLLLLVEYLSAGFAHHVIIANHLWCDRIVKRSVRASKCLALINYPDCSIFHPRDNATHLKEGFVLCYPGSLNQHQGLDVAIAAISRIRQELPTVSLLIIGDGPEKPRLLELTRKLGMDQAIEFRDPVPMEEIAELMASIDLGIVPKRSDSFGNEAFSTKVLEFMAMNVPVVVSNTSIDRFYFNIRIVQFFQSGDSEDLALKVLEVIRDPDRRERLRLEAAKFVRENSWDSKQHEYCNLVDCLSAGTEARESTALRRPTH